MHKQWIPDPSPAYGGAWGQGYIDNNIKLCREEGLETRTRIYGRCLTWSRDSIKLHNIDKQAMVVFVAIKKDLVPSRLRSKTKKRKSQATFPNRFVGDFRSVLVGFLWDLYTVQPFTNGLLGRSSAKKCQYHLQVRL